VASFSEVYCRQDVFAPEYFETHDANKDQVIGEILERTVEKKGKMTECLGFNIETYCKEGSENGMKGVSRVVLVNELG
jgi:hypothetical protein